MNPPSNPSSERRLRILSFDGGPSTAIMLRVLCHLEERVPGFLARTDMFAGSSDGAFASLYLALALSRGDNGLDALRKCIEFHDKVILSFQVNARAVLRTMSGVLSMFDGRALSEILSQHYQFEEDGRSRAATLRDLKWAVSIECFDATTRQTATYTQLKAPQTTLVNAALASAALSPLVPAFRNHLEDATYQGNLMLDGVLANNSPILPAISDGLQLLWKECPKGRCAPESFIDADDDLRKITMLSIGCDVPNQTIVRSVYSIPWPPFGLQKNKNLYEYGLLWLLASNVSWILASMVQRQASDDSLFAMQLIGYERFFRYSTGYEGFLAICRLMLTPRKFIQAAQEQANALWQGVSGAALSGWVQNFWMCNPSLPGRTSVPPHTPAAVG